MNVYAHTHTHAMRTPDALWNGCRPHSRTHALALDARKLALVHDAVSHAWRMHTSARAASRAHGVLPN